MTENSTAFPVQHPSLQLIFCSKLATLCQFVHSFALQWLPIFILLGTSAQQTFGLCQPFPNLPTCLVFRPAGSFTFSFFGAATRRSWPFSYPVRRFLHAWDRRHLHSLHKRCTHPVSGHCPSGWTSDLLSSQLRPELGGSPVESCLRPWRRSNQSGVL